jgi:hypothetical protein
VVSTRPSAFSFSTIRVTVGRLIRSISAIALGASGPSRAIVAKMAARDGESSSPA